MSCGSGFRRRCRRSGVAVLAIVAIGALVMPAEWLNADGESPGLLAQSCGVPPAGANTAGGQPGAGNTLPKFLPDKYPVKLPPVSMLGARNDLPNPYRLGVRWGQLPEGRKWGSTASVSTGPDGDSRMASWPRTHQTVGSTEPCHSASSLSKHATEAVET